MNEQIKQQWIQAINQAHKLSQNFIREDDGTMCPLGHLTDLYLKETNQQWQKDSKVSNGYHFNFHYVTLDPQINKWANLRWEDEITLNEKIADGTTKDELINLIKTF